jgi:hypothetical protein
MLSIFYICKNVFQIHKKGDEDLIGFSPSLLNKLGALYFYVLG